MAAKDNHYPRQGNIPMPMVYSTLDKFGDPKHTLYGGKLDMGGCRTGAGTWWPDFGPTVRDFSPGGVNHPTEFVFQNEVVPYTATHHSRSVPNLAEPAKEKQFRHPMPEREALFKSTNNMPSKPGGRRKCAEASNWKAALSTGREGYRHGGRMPIWCKGPLLDNPDFHQMHPLKRDEESHNIHTSCIKEQVRAGGASGTSVVDALLLTTKTAKALGIKDTEAMREEMTVNLGRSMSHSRTFKAGNTRLNGTMETIKSIRSLPSGSRAFDRDKDTVVSFASMASLNSVASLESGGAEEKLPSWIASRTVATRDPGAAGGQSGPTQIKRIALTRAIEDKR